MLSLDAFLTRTMHVHVHYFETKMPELWIVISVCQKKLICKTICYSLIFKLLLIVFFLFFSFKRM